MLRTCLGGTCIPPPVGHSAEIIPGGIRTVWVQSGRDQMLDPKCEKLFGVWASLLYSEGEQGVLQGRKQDGGNSYLAGSGTDYSRSSRSAQYWGLCGKVV